MVTSAQLRELAARHERTAKKLMDAADALDKVTAQADQSNNKAAAGKTRLEQLRAFLLQNGPMTRREIRARIGLPGGTLAALLTRANFDRDGEGRWFVREKDKREEK